MFLTLEQTAWDLVESMSREDFREGFRRKLREKLRKKFENLLDEISLMSKTLISRDGFSNFLKYKNMKFKRPC